MRKLIYSINLTIDGCLDHTKMNPGDDMLEFWVQVLQKAGVLLYGRITYQLMVPYWPDIAKNHAGQSKGDIEFAETFEAVDKIVVVSRTLDKVERKNTQIIYANLKDEIVKLKQEEGKDILVGGVDLPAQLIALDLVDEYLFVVHPVLAGPGRRLFDGVNLPEKLQLKLIDSTVFGSGCVALRYSKG